MVGNPAFITVIDPVRCSKKVTWLVSWTILDLLGNPLNGTASEDKLDPSNGREFLHGLERVTGELTVEGRVDTSSSDVPSQAGSHGNTTVLEFRLAVVSHGRVALSLGQTNRIKETHWRGDTNSGFVNPCVKRSTLGLDGHRGKGGAVMGNNDNYW